MCYSIWQETTHQKKLNAELRIPAKNSNANPIANLNLAKGQFKEK